MYNLIRWVGVSLALIGVLAGCIQPVDETEPGATPTGVGAAPAAAPVTDPDAGVAEQPPATSSYPEVEQFIQSRGQVPGNLQVWYQQPLDSDRLYGFSYSIVGGLPCAGFVLTALTQGVWQPVNGALLCAEQPAIQALASDARLFATSDGGFYTVIFGRVEDPTISSVAVIYNDASTQNVNIFMGGFLFVKPGVFSATLITAINAEGYTVIDNIPQTEAS